VRPDTLAQLPELLAAGAELVAPKRRTRVAA
jgi:hypothetical protein